MNEIVVSALRCLKAELIFVFESVFINYTRRKKDRPL